MALISEFGEMVADFIVRLENVYLDARIFRMSLSSNLTRQKRTNEGLFVGRRGQRWSGREDRSDYVEMPKLGRKCDGRELLC